MFWYTHNGDGFVLLLEGAILLLKLKNCYEVSNEKTLKVVITDVGTDSLVHVEMIALPITIKLNKLQDR